MAIVCRRDGIEGSRIWHRTIAAGIADDRRIQALKP
jgi:hypothetical protein